MNDNKPRILNNAGRFINDPDISVAVGIVNVAGKKTVAWSVHEQELGPRIYPLSKKDALMLAHSLTRAAMVVDA